MHNRRPIPRSPASPAPEVTPEKRGAAGIGPGNRFAAPSACLYCSFRERRRRGKKVAVAFENGGEGETILSC